MHREGRSRDAEEDIPGRLRLTFLSAVVVVLAMMAARPSRAANACVTAAGNAQDLRDANRLREARAALLVCSQRTCNSVVRADCERWLREVDARTPSLVVRATDTRGRDVLGARVTIDDAPSALDGHPVAVDPGQRRVRVVARSGAVAEQRVLVAPGEKERVVRVEFDVALEEDGTAYVAPSAPVPRQARPAAPVVNEKPSVAPYVLGGAGIAALLVFTYFEISGHAAYADLENGCGKTRSCTDTEIDPVKAKFVGAGVSLGIGLVALGAAAITYVVGRSTAKPVGLVNGFRF